MVSLLKNESSSLETDVTFRNYSDDARKVIIISLTVKTILALADTVKQQTVLILCRGSTDSILLLCVILIAKGLNKGK